MSSTDIHVLIQLAQRSLLTRPSTAERLHPRRRGPGDRAGRLLFLRESAVAADDAVEGSAIIQDLTVIAAAHHGGPKLSKWIFRDQTDSSNSNLSVLKMCWTFVKPLSCWGPSKFSGSCLGFEAVVELGMNRRITSKD